MSEQGRRLGDAEWGLLPDVPALDNLADAASFVAGRIRGGSATDQGVGDGNADARLRALTATPEWRDRRPSALGRS